MLSPIVNCMLCVKKHRGISKTPCRTGKGCEGQEYQVKKK